MYKSSVILLLVCVAAAQAGYIPVANYGSNYAGQSAGAGPANFHYINEQALATSNAYAAKHATPQQQLVEYLVPGYSIQENAVLADAPVHIPELENWNAHAPAVATVRSYSY